MAILALLSLVLGLNHLCHASATSPNTRRVESASTTGLQDVFQVEAPLRSSFEGAACEQVILDHEFAASYGTPYVGTYSPPEDCEFTTVIFNMSVVSAGINYDRLGLLFFGDTEIWRTSTAMPTRTGIYSNFQKDMTIWTSLLKSDQKVIMQLDNIYDSVFTAAWNMTITALYYNDEYPSAPTPAEVILPISSLASSDNASSVFSLPGDNSTVLTAIPRNAARAVVSILASGNGAEEFWYFRVPSQFSSTFANVTLTGHSPFREVQLLIDGQLAGVSWPFPIVYTGGINPALWVPVVGVDAFDVPSFEIDITPWLGVLCDGAAHNFTLAVVGYDSTTLLGTTNSNWYVSGSIFVWVDSNGNQTTGSAPISSTPLPEFDLTSNVSTSDGVNASLSFSLLGSRNLSHQSTIITSTGPKSYTWSQTLTYSHSQYREGYTAYTGNSTIYQITTGASGFTAGQTSNSTNDLITNEFQYPISAVQVSVDPIDITTSNNSLYGAIDRSILSTSIPILSYLTTPSVFSSAARQLNTRQYGYATEYWNDTYYEEAGAIDPAKGSDGLTKQWYSFSGPVGDGSAEADAFGQYVETKDGYETALLVNQTYDTTISVPPTEPLTLPR